SRRCMCRLLLLLALLAPAGCSRWTPAATTAPARVVPITAAAAPRPGGDWPGFLGPTGDSVSPETGILKQWPAGGLRVIWDAQLGGGYAAPSVVGNRVYHFDRHGGQNRLTCRDADTGAEVWRSEYPTDYRDQYGYDGGPRCCPVIDKDQ